MNLSRTTFDRLVGERGGIEQLREDLAAGVAVRLQLQAVEVAEPDVVPSGADHKEEVVDHEHRWKVRTGVRRRFVDDGLGGGRFETVIEDTWAQCTACGMSEGMVALLDAPCRAAPPATSGEETT